MCGDGPTMSGAAYSPHGKPSQQHGKGACEGGKEHVFFFPPKFLSGEGIVSVDIGLELSKVYKLNFKT